MTKRQKNNKTVTKVAVTFTVSLGNKCARVHLPGEDGHGDDHYLVLEAKWTLRLWCVV